MVLQSESTDPFLWRYPMPCSDAVLYGMNVKQFHIVYSNLISYTAISYRIQQSHIVYSNLISYTAIPYRIQQSHIVYSNLIYSPGSGLSLLDMYIARKSKGSNTCATSISKMSQDRLQMHAFHPFLICPRTGCKCLRFIYFKKVLGRATNACASSISKKSQDGLQMHALHPFLKSPRTGCKCLRFI